MPSKYTSNLSWSLKRALKEALFEVLFKKELEKLGSALPVHSHPQN